MVFKKGASALASMIALGTIIVLVTGTTMWIENSRLANYTSNTNSNRVLVATDSGLQDALSRLNLQPSVTDYSTIMDGITVGVCYYPDTPNTGVYTIRTKAIKGGITRSLKALVYRDADTLKFKIYSQEEEIDSPCVVQEITVPNAPQNLIWAGSTSSGVNLTWSAPIDSDSAGISNYKVYRGVVSGGETLLTTLGNTLSYSDTGLTDNTNYYYKVSAVNAIGEGLLSGETLAIPGQPPTAGAVTVSNYAYGNYVGATYQISTPFTSSNTAISCDYSTNGGTTWSGATLSGALPNYTCSKTGVTALDNISYSINMRLTNSIGANSASAITKTGDATGPTVVDNWDDSNWTINSPVTITLAPTDSGAGVSTTKYCTDTNNSCNPSAGTTGVSTSFTCSASSNCTNYIRYAAWDNVNNASQIYYKRVRQDKLVPTDGTLTVTPGNYQNSLSWSGFSDTGSGLAATNTYKVVFLTTGAPNAACSNGTQVYLGSGTSTIHTSLTGGTTYYYRVCAYDAVGNISNGATNNGVPTTTVTTSCIPNCSGKVCGSDGCSGSCGTCSGGTYCSGGTCVPSCTVGATCSSTTYGSWGTCSLSGCSGTQSRSVTTYTYNSSCSCVGNTGSESQTCYASSGASCGTTTSCSLSGCSGSYNTYTCNGSGVCNTNQIACYASHGTSCGSPTYSNCGGCVLNGGCTGQKVCDYTTYSCNGSGSCTSATDPGGGSQSCTASNGTGCGTTYSSWSGCSGDGSCGAYPWRQYRTIYNWHCSSGSCVQDGTCTNCDSRCCTPV